MLINAQKSSEFYRSALQESNSATKMKSTGMEDRVKNFTINNRDVMGVWDAITLADEHRYKMEQIDKRKTLRKKHKDL